MKIYQLRTPLFCDVTQPTFRDKISVQSSRVKQYKKLTLEDKKDLFYLVPYIYIYIWLYVLYAYA